MRLLARIAPGLTDQVENVATAALVHVLGQSSAARRAVLDHVRRLGLEFARDLDFRAQVHATEDEGIPDIAGFDSDGRPVLIIEAKFWAGLTDNQPGTYLDRLPLDKGACLLFVVPDARIGTLWQELLRRAAAHGHQVSETRQAIAGPRMASLGSRALAVTSWTALLSSVAAALREAGDSENLGDIDQLIGLCARIDEDAFLPVRAPEFAPSVPRRLLQYVAIVDQVANDLIASGIAAKEGPRGRLKATPQREGYGHYLYLGRWIVFVAFDAKRWAHLAETPLWLVPYGFDRHSSGSVEAARSRRALIVPGEPRFLPDPTEGDSSVAAPLWIPTGAERDVVVADLLEQVRQLKARLDAALPPLSMKRKIS